MNNNHNINKDKDINKDLLENIKELKDLMLTNEIQGYFLCVTIGDNKGYTRYDSTKPLASLGLLEAMLTDYKLSVIDALDIVLHPDIKSVLNEDYKNRDKSKLN